MLNCEICNREFQDYISLGSHIGQSHRNIGIKNYYNRFMKTNPTEGICKNPDCKKPTKFVYLTFGYNDCCSRACSNTIRDYKEIYSSKSKQICQFCGREFISKTALASHLYHPTSIHKDEITTIKLEKEKKKKIKCKICGKNMKLIDILAFTLFNFTEKEIKILNKNTMINI